MSTPAPGFRAWLALAAGVVVVDHITKFIASRGLSYDQPVPVFPGFNLTLLHNSGAAFSFLAEAGGWQRWLFCALALGISLYLVVLLRASSAPAYRGGLSLILGGAIGNLIDRINLGYVVDFIQVYYKTWFWPTFNVADSAITLGAGLLIYSTFRAQPSANAAKGEDRWV